ncbi:hypothetical protein D0T49_02900 [Paludibacter sp. 221]|uniref:anti-sigma factor family protein n=1 Tax=Paludibacter sp. 221 TaxID=2302939 RepID=UPI0013D717E0|nr:hypothetical protein [Paludibacter sp. 221]NDV45987.1 hypothetical protein [Paludibacter sp. 221]
MDKCKYTKHDIADYHQNRMTRKEETEMQAHLTECSKCQKELKAIRKLDDFLKQKDENKKGFPISPYWLIAAPVAAAVGLLLALFPFERGEDFRVIPPDKTNYGNIDTLKTDTTHIKNDTIKMDTIIFDDSSEIE